MAGGPKAAMYGSEPGIEMAQRRVAGGALPGHHQSRGVGGEDAQEKPTDRCLTGSERCRGPRQRQAG